MICWVFAGITLGAVAVATFVKDIKRAVLSLWVAGLGIGAVYLTLGAELLAIVQWIVSTLVAISFIFFAVMFGEYRKDGETRVGQKVAKFVMAILLGGAFAWLIWYGAGQVPESMLEQPADGTDIAAIGRSLTEDHLLSLEVLALSLFLVLVGGGVIARPEKQKGAGGA